MIVYIFKCFSGNSKSNKYQYDINLNIASLKYLIERLRFFFSIYMQYSYI